MRRTSNIRTYHDLIQIPSFLERYEYLKIGGVVGETTFGYERYLNQMLYSSRKWKDARNRVLIRDDGCDMGLADYPIGEKIYVHHMNPITPEMVEENDPVLFEPEFLSCVSYQTHNAIHYGDKSLLPQEPIQREPNDTCPWRK